MQVPVPLLQQKRKSSNKMELNLRLWLRQYSQVFVMKRRDKKSQGEAKITVAGTPGTRTVTTTYTVNSTDGSIIPHEGKPVIKPSTLTMVKSSS